VTWQENWGLIAAVGALWQPDMCSVLNSVFAKAVFPLASYRMRGKEALLMGKNGARNTEIQVIPANCSIS
jgi:hypothetical protein